MSGNEFLRTVQLHERAWGTDNYPKRPSLEDMLNAAVVVFWKYGNEDRWRASLYSSLKEVEAELTQMLMRINIAPPKRSIARIYGRGRRVCMEQVRIKFGYCDKSS